MGPYRKKNQPKKYELSPHNNRRNAEVGIEKDGAKYRTCLGLYEAEIDGLIQNVVCGKTFWSLSPGMRLCAECEAKRNYMDQEEPVAITSGRVYRGPFHG